MINFLLAEAIPEITDSSIGVLTELGVGGILVVLILKLVFDFLKERKNGNGKANVEISEIRQDIDDIAHKIDELYRWHSVVDEDGVKVWYIRRSLEKVIESLSNNIEMQTDVLKSVVSEIRATKKDVAELRQDIKETRHG